MKLTYYHVMRIGSGTFADPFRPDGVNKITWGSWQQADGSFLVWCDPATPPTSLTATVLGNTIDSATQALGVVSPAETA
jgi:hypothetical protein